MHGIVDVDKVMSVFVCDPQNVDVALGAQDILIFGDSACHVGTLRKRQAAQENDLKT